MKKLFLLFLTSTLLLLGIGKPGHAQTPAWQMALATPGVINSGGITGSGSQVTATATDASGNVYVGGNFFGTLTVGNLSLPSSSTGFPSDGFVAKWVPANNSFAWVARIASVPRTVPAGNIANNVVVESLTVSGSNVYVGGDFSEASITLGSGTLNNAGGSNGTRDGFLARLTDAGSSATWAWSQRVGGSGGDIVSAVAVSGTSVYAAGSFSGTATGFGSTTLTSAGSNDMFVTKLTDAGSSATTNWAQRLGGTGDDGADKLIVNGTALLLSGAFSNAVTFGAATLVSAGGYDGFVAKLVDAGSGANVSWTQAVGGSGNDEVVDVAANDGSVYITGLFAATLTLGATILSSAGGSDGFVAKLTDTGTASTYTWAKSMGGLREDAGLHILANSGGKVYVAGYFGYNGNATTTAPATFGATTLQSVGGADMFVTKLVDTGSTSSFAWTQQAGSTYTDLATGVAISGTRLYVGGIFNGPSIAFGSTTLTNPQSTGSISDGFLAALTDLTLPTRAAALPAALRLYPNPASGTTTVPVPEAPGVATATLTLTDMLGRTVRTAQPLPGTDYPLSLSGLAPGVYLVQVLAGETLAAQRLVVQ